MKSSPRHPTLVFVKSALMSINQITAETVISRSESLISNSLGEDVVMMDIEEGAYYGLEAVAASIWKHTETPISVGSLCELLMKEYKISNDRCLQEVTKFLGDMVDRKMVQISD